MIAVSQWQLAAENDPDEWAGRQLSATQPPDSGFQLRDGAVLFSLRGDGEAWDKFFIALNRMDLAADPRFAVSNLLVISRDLEAAIRDDSEAMERGRISSPDSRRTRRHHYRAEQTLHGVMHDEQTAAIGAVQTMNIRSVGACPPWSPPWKFSEPLTALRRPAPFVVNTRTRSYASRVSTRRVATFRAQRVVG